MELIYRYLCGACGAVMDVKYVGGLHMILPRPWPPEGWRDIEGTLYCPDHRIDIKIRRAKTA